MASYQPGILSPIPIAARHLLFAATPGARPERALRALRDCVDGEQTIAGLGGSLVQALGHEVPGLRVFPAHAGAGFEVPSTPAALWCWLRGAERGELVHRARRIEQALAPDLLPSLAIEAFRYGSGRDLTGYEDGTENPQDDKALEAAIVRGAGAGLDGASFVAVQQWLHDFARFEAMSADEQDRAIGRRKIDNEEIGDAPPSAHVKRTAQESFTPAAFVLRRSMPWSDGSRAGLMFVAFGKSFDAFEAQLRRMEGLEDGVADALFRFTRPVSGGYFWCPPMRNGRLDLGALGL
jgi:putative iron-dependent peroxidase